MQGLSALTHVYSEAAITYGNGIKTIVGVSEERGKLLWLLIIHLGTRSENSIELLATLTHSLTNFHFHKRKTEKTRFIVKTQNVAEVRDVRTLIKPKLSNHLTKYRTFLKTKTSGMKTKICTIATVQDWSRTPIKVLIVLSEGKKRTEAREE